jgi:hypothetical protein
VEDEEWQDYLDDDGEEYEVLDHEEEMEIIRSLVGDDQEAFDRMNMVDAHCAMLTEAKYCDALKEIQREHGESGVMNLLFAVERQTGWHLEIVASKSDIDDALFNIHGLYDDKAWDKARNSETWTAMTYDVNYLARRYSRDMVDEVAGVPGSPIKAIIRKKLFDLWKSIDLSLM